MNAIANSSHASSAARPVLDRLRGPGGLYNIGNALALAAALGVQLSASAGGAGVLDTAAAYLFGSPGATWLTLAMLVFFVSGEFYHRAWAGRDSPDPRLNRAGDLTSGLGALCMTAALAHFGDVVLALVAGTLLAGGKFGTALLPAGPASARAERACRWAVILSRAPSFCALGLELAAVMRDGGPAADAFMPAVMILCFALWLRADVLLLRPAGAPASQRVREEVAHA